MKFLTVGVVLRKVFFKLYVLVKYAKTPMVDERKH